MPAERFVVSTNRIDNASDVPVTVDLVENPTITANGTALNEVINLNRNSSNTSLVQVFLDPTSSGGLVLETERLFQQGGGGNNTPTFRSAGAERIFRLDTPYEIRVTNNSNSTITYQFIATWFEIPPEEFTVS